MLKLYMKSLVKEHIKIMKERLSDAMQDMLKILKLYIR